MVAPAAHPEPADAADDNARRCIRCDYLLIGLPESGACPECGTPIAESAAPVNLLRDQDPGWLGRLAEGLLWQIVANLAAVAGFLMDVLGAMQPATEPGRQFPLSTALYLLFLFLNWCAAWWITTPEPRVVEAAVSLRRSVRGVATCSAVALLTVTVIPFNSVAVWAVVTAAGALLPLADVILWYLYVHRLALRLPSPGLTFQILLLLCGGSISTLFAHTLPWLATVREETASDVGNAYRFGGGCAVLVSNGLMLYAAYVCFRLRARLLRERDESAASPGAEEMTGTGA
jgi:hypothetical protein